MVVGVMWVVEVVRVAAVARRRWDALGIGWGEVIIESKGARSGACIAAGETVGGAEVTSVVGEGAFDVERAVAAWGDVGGGVGDISEARYAGGGAEIAVVVVVVAKWTPGITRFSESMINVFVTVG